MITVIALYVQHMHERSNHCDTLPSALNGLPSELAKGIELIAQH